MLTKDRFCAGLLSLTVEFFRSMLNFPLLVFLEMRALYAGR
jgi:hypothetical protein